MMEACQRNRSQPERAPNSRSWNKMNNMVLDYKAKLKLSMNIYKYEEMIE